MYDAISKYYFGNIEKIIIDTGKPKIIFKIEEKRLNEMGKL